MGSQQLSKQRKKEIELDDFPRLVPGKLKLLIHPSDEEDQDILLFEACPAGAGDAPSERVRENRESSPFTPPSTPRGSPPAFPPSAETAGRGREAASGGLGTRGAMEEGGVAPGPRGQERARDRSEEEPSGGRAEFGETGTMAAGSALAPRRAGMTQATGSSADQGVSTSQKVGSDPLRRSPGNELVSSGRYRDGVRDGAAPGGGSVRAELPELPGG